jgi:HlyD family secretion protein
MKRVLIILAVLVVLGVAAVWAYQNFSAQAEEPQMKWEEVIVQHGTLAAMVNTTGTILPEKQTSLSFKNPGRVEEVLVQEGQAVHADEILARLETTDLEYSVAQAEQNVAQAEQSLAQAEQGVALAELSVAQADLGVGQAQAQLLRVQSPASQYDIATAQAALASAQAAYRRLLAGPTAEEIQVARTNLDQAEAALAQAQAAYDQVADRPDVAMLPQSLQLEQASIAYEAAKANFDLTMRQPSEADLAAARSAIVQAESTLAQLQEGVSDEDILIAQLQVEQAQLSYDQAQFSLIQAQLSRDQAQLSRDQAQLSYDQAQHQLEGMVLAAPHEGTITLVSIKEGELSGGQPAFILTDLSVYHIDVTVDEIDIGRVAVGQPVTITLDALPGETLSGQVDRIAETAQLDSGVVTYKVTIQLEPSDASLRVGMTANVDIVTDLRQDVLLVPNRFIRIDRTTSQAFVDLADGDQIQSVEIQIGLRDEFSSEVLAGLEEGDMVVLVEESSREQLRQTMMGP